MGQSVPVGSRPRFVYHQIMDVHDPDSAVAPIAAAIGEPARARMLYCLVDGRARTSTELAAVADVTPSTASVHLQRLRAHRLVKVFAQGKHRYYSLDRPDVAAALEALNVLAGGTAGGFVPSTPHRLRGARTCYDHIAGTLGVALYDRFIALGWLTSAGPDGSCDLTPQGCAGFAAFGIDAEAARTSRRRFAFACLDWSERRPHLGGALGATVLRLALRRRWVTQDLDSRILRITSVGSRELRMRFGVASGAG
jgi:DNA-binding transcriptional ArsR family regulator